MSDQKKFKKEVRRVAQEKGISYTAARRIVKYEQRNSE